MLARQMGKQAFARLINIGQRAERALTFLQTDGQKQASGMPVGNTTHMTALQHHTEWEEMSQKRFCNLKLPKHVFL